MDKLESINFDYYEFDENEGIYSKHFKRFCKGTPNKDGYITVWLKTIDGKKDSFKYHRVMCYVFNPRPKEFENIPYEELDVNHKNQNPSDNRASNLEWCTTEYNVNYGNGNQKRSETCKKVPHTEEWNTKVSEALSIPIVQVKDDGTVVHWESIAECNDNGYTQSAVSQCCNNKFHPKCRNHRRYKGSEWYFKYDYEKIQELNLVLN